MIIVADLEVQTQAVLQLGKAINQWHHQSGLPNQLSLSIHPVMLLVCEIQSSD